VQWARLQTDLNLQIRRGAWYRIRQLGSLEAVIEVRGQQLLVPAPFIEIIERPPRRWTVVPRPRDAVRLPPEWGNRYAVCPSCRERQQIVGRPRRMTCQRCRIEFHVGWNEWAHFGREPVSARWGALLAQLPYEVLRPLVGRGEIVRGVVRV
jgi:hypothetical protein